MRRKNKKMKKKIAAGFAQPDNPDFQMIMEKLKGWKVNW